MIEINLLPPGRRVIEHTPIARFLTLVAVVVITMVGLFVAVRLHFREIPALKEKLGRTHQEKEALKAQLSDQRAKEAEIAALLKKRETWRKLQDNRVRWARIWARLWKAFEAEYPKVVLEQLDFRKKSRHARPGQPAAEAYTMLIKGTVWGNENPSETTTRFIEQVRRYLGVPLPPAKETNGGSHSPPTETSAEPEGKEKELPTHILEARNFLRLVFYPQEKLVVEDIPDIQLGTLRLPQEIQGKAVKPQHMGKFSFEMDFEVMSLEEQEKIGKLWEVRHVGGRKGPPPARTAGG